MSIRIFNQRNKHGAWIQNLFHFLSPRINGTRCGCDKIPAGNPPLLFHGLNPSCSPEASPQSGKGIHRYCSDYRLTCCLFIALGLSLKFLWFSSTRTPGTGEGEASTYWWPELILSRLLWAAAVQTNAGFGRSRSDAEHSQLRKDKVLTTPLSYISSI